MHDAPHLQLCLTEPAADDLAAAVEAGRLTILAEVLRAKVAPWAPVMRLPWDQVAAGIAPLLTTAGAWRAALLDLAGAALAQAGDAAFIARMAPLPQGLEDPVLPAPRAIQADMAVIGDFRRPDEVNIRAMLEIRAMALAGQRVVLVQVSNGKSAGSIHPGFDALVRRGLAQVLGPRDLCEVEVAQVLIPRLSIPALGVTRPAIAAHRWWVTETEASSPDWDALRLQGELQRLYGVLSTWSAPEGWTRQALAALVPGPVRAWPEVVAQAAPQSPPPKTCAAEPVLPVIGLMAYDPADLGDWPAELATLAEVHVNLAGNRRSLVTEVPKGCHVLALEGLDTVSFVNRIDAFVVAPATPPDRLPRTALALALSRGILVLAGPGHAPLLGEGPRYAEPASWPAILAHLRGGTATLVPELDATAFIETLGLTSRRPLSQARSDRVLFVTANGVGLGHVTRLSAIARRLPPEVEPIFATMSQAASVLKDMGFFCELLTGYTGRPADAWQASLRERMLSILDYHQPRAVVLDSSNPYPGVLEALVSRPEIALIWVRRGMWRATQDNSDFLTRAPYFDRIIEPQDIAEANDPSPLAAPRVVKVPPIGLLDEAELLPQREARLGLGLSADTPPGGSVLVQLGSGTTRDLDTLLDQVLATLGQFSGLEIVLAQWLNTASAYDARWPGVRILSGYPIPRYYRAFDFTVSAAGYNSFNDLLRFALPTIFVANDAMNMDDQGARARYAETQEAAFEVPETDLSPLADCVAAILQPQVRAHLQERSRAIALPNGAADAARAIMEVLR